MSVLFAILIIEDVHGHKFEIYTFVSKTHKNVNIVLGIKKGFDIEGVINS